MNEKVLIGCDVSKAKIDFFCGLSEEHFILKNSKEGFQKLNEWINHNHFGPERLSFAYEHTGIYSDLLADFCFKNRYEQFAVPGLEIRRSLGIARGKDDKVDSKRIYVYLKEKQYKLRPLKEKGLIVCEIKRLKSLRDKLVKDRAGYKSRLKETREVLKLRDSDIIVKVQTNVIAVMDGQIEVVEQKIEELLSSDDQMAENYRYLKSVPGVGPVLSTELIIETENFVKFKNARCFASYCGVAPFPNRSGKKKGKTRVNHLANKKMKCLLDLGAKTAILHDPEIKRYYERKVAEGKHPRSVRNAVRFKLLTRMFSVVKNKREFQKRFYNNLE